VIAL
jgi:hypothetical protein